MRAKSVTPRPMLTRHQNMLWTVPRFQTSTYVASEARLRQRLTTKQFDVGESYAGLVPISSAADETRKLFFWCVWSITILFAMLTITTGSFHPRTLLLRTRLLYGEVPAFILSGSQADSSFLGSMVALAAALLVVSSQRMVPLRGKPAPSLLQKIPTHG